MLPKDPAELCDAKAETKKPSWLAYTAAAVCVTAVVVGGGVTWASIRHSEPKRGPKQPSTSGPCVVVFDADPAEPPPDDDGVSFWHEYNVLLMLREGALYEQV